MKTGFILFRLCYGYTPGYTLSNDRFLMRLTKAKKYLYRLSLHVPVLPVFWNDLSAIKSCSEKFLLY